jgi:hypothetical protein
MRNLNSFIRSALAAIVGVAAVSLLTHSTVSPATLTPPSPVREFYITPHTFDGSHVLTACATGFHMASVWEIHEPSNLRYDTGRGLKLADSGAGPPAGPAGWIRTGYLSAGSTSGSPGETNCKAWTSNNSADMGAVAGLAPGYWGGGSPTSPIAPWTALSDTCDRANVYGVWCVQNW